MSDIRRVYVWIRLPGGKSCPLGEIATQMDEEGGRIQGQFRYADDWLDHPDGFNIDPANLAWVSGPQDAGRPREGIHSVFEDALPDDWGQQMMAVIHNLSRRQMRLPDLLPLMEYRALGALMFSDTPVIDEPPASAKEAAVEMGKQWYAGMVSGFEQELAVRNDKHRQKLADVASSPGGGRGPSSCTRNR
ncbi:HipA N-terminal domain-containing protein, partial [Thiolapillus sp.]|uniref:HipA N-terminal domain-containing protein n=1 Tax=Thiolapillus sp. TaxID=2017437 RepID=UPI0025D9CF2B